MLYIGYIYLVDDVTYIWARCIRYYEINHELRVLQSLTADFFSYRLFDRFHSLPTTTNVVRPHTMTKGMMTIVRGQHH